MHMQYRRHIEPMHSRLPQLQLQRGGCALWYAVHMMLCVSDSRAVVCAVAIPGQLPMLLLRLQPSATEVAPLLLLEPRHQQLEAEVSHMLLRMPGHSPTAAAVLALQVSRTAFLQD